MTFNYEMVAVLMVAGIVILAATAVVVDTAIKVNNGKLAESCSEITNETYDDYLNSGWCRFNGTAWESRQHNITEWI